MSWAPTFHLRDVDDEEGPRYQVGHAPRGPVEEAMSAAAHEIVIFVQSVRDEYWKKGANLERMVNRLRAVRGLDRREVLPVLLVVRIADVLTAVMCLRTFNMRHLPFSYYAYWA